MTHGAATPDVARQSLGSPQRGVVAAVGAYLLAYLVYAVVAHQALFADGAAVLLRAAGARGVSALDTNRIVADTLFQWPVLVAAWLGVTDLQVLSYLLGVGYHYLVVVTLPLAWWLLPRERRDLMLFPILSLLFGWMGSSFLAIHQANALALWFWPVFFTVLLRPAERRRDVLLLVALALPMMALYDTVLLLGPVLAAVAGWRWLRQPAARHRWLWAALVLWFIAAAAISLGFILLPRSPGNRANFIWSLRTAAFLVGEGGSTVNWPLALALIAAPLLSLAAWRPAWLSATRWVWLPPFVLAAAFVALAPILSPATFSPFLQFFARSIAGLLPAGLAILLLIANAHAWRPGEATRAYALLLLSLIAVAQITWHIVATAQWEGYLGIFRATLAERSGLIAFETTPMAQPAIGIQVLRRLTWGWTNPWLSVALAPHGQVAAIVANPGSASAGSFDPTRPMGLPPIAGVNYDAYIAALQRPAPK